MEATHVMEVAQLLLSLLHSWGLDPNLDKVCETQLGLLKPMVSNVIAFYNSYLNCFIWIVDSDFVWRTIKGRLYVITFTNMAKQC